MSYVEDVAGGKDAAGVAAEASQDEGGAAAEIIGDVEAAGDGEVRASAGGLRVRHLENVVGFHGDGGFTQFIYFRSEAAARAGETAMQDKPELAERLRETIEGDLAFFDLVEPDID